MIVDPIVADNTELYGLSSFNSTYENSIGRDIVRSLCDIDIMHKPNLLL